VASFFVRADALISPQLSELLAPATVVNIAATLGHRNLGRLPGVAGIHGFWRVCYLSWQPKQNNSQILCVQHLDKLQYLDFLTKQSGLYRWSERKFKSFRISVRSGFRMYTAISLKSIEVISTSMRCQPVTFPSANPTYAVQILYNGLGRCRQKLAWAARRSWLVL